MMKNSKLQKILIDAQEGQYYIQFERRDRSVHSYPVSLTRLIKLLVSYEDRDIFKYLNINYWR